MSSQPGPQPYTGSRLIRIIFLLFTAIALLGLPIAGYFIGNFIGLHMAVSDIQNGYAYGGLLSIVAQTTHNSVYAQEANVSQGLGITEGQTDMNTFAVAGLILGLILDAPLAYLAVSEYEKMP